VDFTFSEEQEVLRSTARTFLEREVGHDGVRSMIDGGGFSDDLWRRFVDLGWTGVLVPEGRGGTGHGMLEVAVLAEEMGWWPLPGPWLSSAVAATLVATFLGDRDGQEALTTGARRATVAIEEGGHRDPLAGIAATARRRGDTWELAGTKPVVLDGHTADRAYVVARDADGLATFVLDDPRGEPVPTMDVTRQLARVQLSGRSARRIGPAGDQRALLQRVVDDIGIALCAESVGACERALHMATEYAKDRVQFDRPIATFQAIRHKLVDMLHQLELARVATHFAAWASSVDDPQRESAAAIAKGVVGDAAAMITGENIQVHGGVGFTWDVDCHLLFRRVKANDVLFGRQAWQRQRLADLVIPTVIDTV
jgi:alkylation response protein AidB-like acyl-CoA dehydrogenase